MEAEYTYRILHNIVVCQKEAINKTEGQISSAYNHLVKLLVIYDIHTHEHWIKEITEMMRRITRYKYNNNPLTLPILEKLVKDTANKNTIDSEIKSTLIAYCKHPRNIKQRVTVRLHNTKDTIKDIQSFLLDQAQLISQEDWNSTDCYNQLVELFDRYYILETKTLELKELK